MGGNEMARVIVLQGGSGPEAGVSRVSAAGVAKVLAGLGVEHELWELEDGWENRLAGLDKNVVVFCNALHGAPGEDGTVQAVLERLGLRYTGSNAAASALAMDKLRAVEIFRQAGLPVAESRPVAKAVDIAPLVDMWGKVVIKPVDGGSSLGVSVVEKASDAPKAYEVALAAGYGRVMAEAFVAGRELTVGVLLGREHVRVLPVVEILAVDKAFYDYDSKYVEGGSRHVCPAELEAPLARHVQEIAAAASRAVGAAGACRVDFRYDPQTGVIALLEVNTLPGMTPTSLLPDGAAAVGMDYAALVLWMIENARVFQA